MKKIISIISITLLVSLNSFSQSTNWIWAKSAGGINDEIPNSMTTDVSGNIYVTGSFSSPVVTFGSTTLTNTSSFPFTDIFLVKYDANGNVIWAKSGGGTDNDYPTSVATDAAGNIYLTGYYKSPTITFGATTLTNSGNNDMFLVKYNSSGNLVWAKSAGGTNDDECNAVTVDRFNNVCITGFFKSPTIIFDSDTIVNVGLNSAPNFFVARFDSLGNILWARSSGGTPNTSIGNSIVTDAFGNVYVGGEFWDYMIEFHNDSTTTYGGYDNANLVGNSCDIFLAAFSPSGHYQMVKTFGGVGDDNVTSLSIDVNGVLYMGGYFNSYVMNVGFPALSNPGGSTALFFARLDVSGNCYWAKSAGGVNFDEVTSVSADNSGYVFVAGNFSSPSINMGLNTLTNIGGNNLFIAKYSLSGNEVWAEGATGTGWNWASCVVNDNINNATYLSGYFGAFNIKFGNTLLLDSGSYDFFLTKLIGNTGLNENSHLNKEVSIYPNPASSTIIIHQSTQSHNQQLLITNILGEEIYHQAINNSTQTTIDVSQWSNGVYFYQLRGDKETLQGKFVVEK